MPDLSICTLETETPFLVTDLKQWAYCPRVLYFHTCLPEVRPVTFKMEAGIEAGQEEEGRELRRSLRVFGLPEEPKHTACHWRREFDVEVSSARLGLRGRVDLVIWRECGRETEVFPVDYKLSERPGEHFKLQLAAYGIMLEEMSGASVKVGFLYSIPLRKAEKILINRRLREKLAEALETMQHMLWSESMPAPTAQRGKCLSCEFRRFCNDVL